MHADEFHVNTYDYRELTGLGQAPPWRWLVIPNDQALILKLGVIADGFEETEHDAKIAGTGAIARYVEQNRATPGE